MLRVLGLAAIVVGACAAMASAAISGRGLRTAEHFVAQQCHKGSVRSKDMWESDPSFRFNALYGDCGGGDGHDQRIWFFDGSQFVGTDARKSSAAIIGLWRDLNTISFMYVLYGPSDALCCATGGGAVVRYRWAGKRLVRLGPMPPRRATGDHPGRYP